MLAGIATGPASQSWQLAQRRPVPMRSGLSNRAIFLSYLEGSGRLRRTRPHALFLPALSSLFLGHMTSEACLTPDSSKKRAGAEVRPTRAYRTQLHRCVCAIVPQGLLAVEALRPRRIRLLALPALMARARARRCAESGRSPARRGGKRTPAVLAAARCSEQLAAFGRPSPQISRHPHGVQHVFRRITLKPACLVPRLSEGLSLRA